MASGTSRKTIRWDASTFAAAVGEHSISSRDGGVSKQLLTTARPLDDGLGDDEEWFMIEAKLLVGRFLQLTTAPTRPMRGVPPIFDIVVCPPLTIQESTRFAGPLGGHFGQKASAVVAGTNPNPAKIHRNLKWLPYYEGDISATTQTCDVLTGPMSGCPLVRYMHAGQIHVGHIGTVLGQVAVNAAVTALWNAFALANPGSVLGGFNPFGAGVPLPPAATGQDSVARIWGLITTAGGFFSVQVYQQLNQANYYRVAAVHAVPSMTLAQLQALH